MTDAELEAVVPALGRTNDDVFTSARSRLARRLSTVLVALLGVAVLDVQPANATSCESAPYAEQLFLELESVTEDGSEIMDSSYLPYTVLLDGNAYDEKTRLWVITASEAWWQDFQ